MKRLLWFALLLAWATGCVAETPAEIQTAVPIPTGQGTQTTALSVQPQPSPSATLLITATPPPLPPTPTFPADSTPIILSPPAPSGGAGGTTVNAIQEPLLIDGEKGWIVAQAQVNTVPKTVVLSTADGRLLTTYDVVGKVALDRTRNQIIVDTGQNGLVVLDAETGLEMARIDLPAAEEYASPQVDPDSGLIYAFRGRDLYLIDLVHLGNQQVYQTAVEGSICSEPAGFSTVWRSDYDLINHRLYLTFQTYVCTPWVQMTIVAYDAPISGTTELKELGRFDVEQRYQAVAFLDNLYGTTISRMGPTSFWAWNGSQQPWFHETVEFRGMSAGIVADWRRRLLYESIGSRVRIVDPITRKTVHEVQLPLLVEGGRLTGHDPITDQVYLLTASGQLQYFAAQHLTQEAIIMPPEAEAPPKTAVSALAVGSTWGTGDLDDGMAGLWKNGDCPVEGGLLYILRPDSVWLRSVVSEDGECEAIGAFALPSTFGATNDIFAASNNNGAVFKSTDAGRTWQQVGQPFLEGASFRQLLISPDYGTISDRTLFAHASNGEVFRSQDDGQNWRPLNLNLDHLAISPEIAQNRTLVGTKNSALYISHDWGDSWRQVGSTPGNETLAMLSIAPALQDTQAYPAGVGSEQWQKLFAFSTAGNFYRSLDAGITWELAIGTSPAEQVQIVYAAGMEVNRPIFLLHGGMLDASYDGWNSTWTAPSLPPTVTSPITALAISPTFSQDGRLFVGTADGQVIGLDAGLPSGSNEQ